MSVLDITSGDLFTVRIFKNLVTNPLNEWSNSYEVKAYDTLSSVDLLVEVRALVRFEKAIHKDVVQFTRMVVSTWEPDSVPYDPASFVVDPLTGQGAVGPVGDNLALNQVLVVKRNPVSGRSGHIFYRGVLNEADTEAPAGRLVLSDPSGTADTIETALTDADVSNLYGVTPSNGVGLVMISADGSQVRVVNSLTASGCTTLPTDHAWFNRTSP